MRKVPTDTYRSSCPVCILQYLEPPEDLQTYEVGEAAAAAGWTNPLPDPGLQSEQELLEEKDAATAARAAAWGLPYFEMEAEPAAAAAGALRRPPAYRLDDLPEAAQPDDGPPRRRRRTVAPQQQSFGAAAQQTGAAPRHIRTGGAAAAAAAAARTHMTRAARIARPPPLASAAVLDELEPAVLPTAAAAQPAPGATGDRSLIAMASAALNDEDMPPQARRRLGQFVHELNAAGRW